MAEIKRSKKHPDSYVLNGTYSGDTLLGIAENILSERLYQKTAISSPEDIKQYLKLHFRDEINEVFCVVFLNSQHEILAIENLFTGTIDSANVYPREVIRKVIEHNAAAIILAHNHPSGNSKPSDADKVITDRLSKALQYIDARILDHIIVGENQTTSFAVEGWL